MKYKPGDIVTIREDLEDGEVYYMEDGSHNTAVGEMLDLCGTRQIIKLIASGQYRLEGDESYCLWTDEMFEDDRAEEVEELNDEGFLSIVFGG